MPSSVVEEALVRAWSPLHALGVKLPEQVSELLGGDSELESDIAMGAVLSLYWVVAMAVLRPKAERPAAWLLTAFSALTCSAAFFVSWLHLVELPDFPVGVPDVVLLDTPFSRFTARYFRVTLAMDLLLGFVFYRNQLDPLTSWFHHTAYFALLTWAIRSRVTHCFTLFLVEEIPTFFLALGSIDKRLRYDFVFGGTFFTLRIIYHSVHFYAIFWLWSRSDWRDPLHFDVIRGNMILTMFLHLHWFSGWVRQQVRLRKKAAAVVAAKQA